MRLTLAHARAALLELVRVPAFVVPTLGFPALLYVLFALPRVREADAASIAAGFAVTAVIGVAFFQFGVGIAIGRTLPWDAYLRVLPAAPWQRTAARVLSAVVFAALAAGLVLVVAVAASPVRIGTAGWAWLAAALLAGSVPFSLLGIALGYWLPPKAALPVANVLFLPVVYVGGLWTVGRDLPGRLAEVSPYVPSRPWGDLVWAAVEGRSPPGRSAATLAVYTVAFGLFAVWAYRRDEGERFR